MPPDCDRRTRRCPGAMERRRETSDGLNPPDPTRERKPARRVPASADWEGGVMKTGDEVCLRHLAADFKPYVGKITGSQWCDVCKDITPIAVLQFPAGPLYSTPPVVITEHWVTAGFCPVCGNPIWTNAGISTWAQSPAVQRSCKCDPQQIGKVA